MPNYGGVPDVVTILRSLRDVNAASPYRQRRISGEMPGIQRRNLPGEGGGFIGDLSNTIDFDMPAIIQILQDVMAHQAPNGALGQPGMQVVPPSSYRTRRTGGSPYGLPGTPFINRYGTQQYQGGVPTGRTASRDVMQMGIQPGSRSSTSVESRARARRRRS